MSSRRTVLKSLGVMSGAALLGRATPRAFAEEVSAPPRSTGKAQLVYGEACPVVQTQSGPLRGYIRNGIHTFKGIPYGESTAGKTRFMPPVRKGKWEGIYPAVAYGYASPQVHGKDWANPASHFLFDFDFGQMDEDCLRLNVWTPAVGSGKRPVFVWIHGGGYSNGSSFEMKPYDGENMTRRGDIVFVSVNHRLNVLGFLDVSSVGGDAFASSPNASMLDLVSALEWVRDNIAQFGGDPSNVTICGHSGGGAKVNALAAMPSARGLFHKGIVMSGSIPLRRTPDESRLLGERTIQKLNLTDVGKLQALPYDQLMGAASAAITELNAEHPSREAFGRYGWSPTLDGKTITAAELSSEIPMLVGYTRHELATPAYDPRVNSLLEADVRSRLEQSYPGKAASLIDLYRAQYPSATWPELYSTVASMMFANGAIEQFEQRVASGKGPLYAYRFDWISDVMDRRLGAFHSLELAFTFDNTDRWDSATGGGPRPQALASRMSDAWIAFARTGNPNHRGLPQWQPYGDAQKSVMLFNDVCAVKRSPDERAHQLLG